MNDLVSSASKLQRGQKRKEEHKIKRDLRDIINQTQCNYFFLDLDSNQPSV